MLAGLTARAGVGVGGLEEAVHALERSHAGGNTSFRFALREGEIHVQVGQVPRDGAEDGEGAGWRTLVEFGS